MISLQYQHPSIVNPMLSSLACVVCLMVKCWAPFCADLCWQMSCTQMSYRSSASFWLLYPRTCNTKFQVGPSQTSGTSFKLCTTLCFHSLSELAFLYQTFSFLGFPCVRNVSSGQWSIHLRGYEPASYRTSSIWQWAISCTFIFTWETSSREQWHNNNNHGRGSCKPWSGKLSSPHCCKPGLWDYWEGRSAWWKTHVAGNPCIDVRWEGLIADCSFLASPWKSALCRTRASHLIWISGLLTKIYFTRK